MSDLDSYDRTARLTPVYLVCLPAAVAVIVLSLQSHDLWKKLVGVVIACGLPRLAVEWGRAAGRRQQSSLFARWGGAPTVDLLRFRTLDANRVLVEQRHAAVEGATGVHLPSSAEEDADPAGADSVYEAAGVSLRELTRDQARFPLLAKENRSYGFRRNLWGRKPYGLGVAMTVGVLAVTLLVAGRLGHEVLADAGLLIVLGVAFLTLVVWTFVVTPEWVREAADAYAERLIGSAQEIVSGRK